MKLGDCVTLNSGGPLMTVVKIDGTSIYCTWFAGDQAKHGLFNISSLKKPETKKDDAS